MVADGESLDLYLRYTRIHSSRFSALGNWPLPRKGNSKFDMLLANIFNPK